MWKYSFAVLSSFVIIALAKEDCCKNKERATSYLEVAKDLLSKAQLIIPECKKDEDSEDKECSEIAANDCADWYEKGYNISGVYTIWPISRVTENKSLEVYCDMDTDGGGWTVIQRRGDFGSPNDLFDKDWKSYRNGFGDIQKEFWLGNDNTFALSNQKLYTIRFDLQEKSLKKGYAKYSAFWIDDEFHKYTLHVANYSGNVGDAMTFHSKRIFTTKDKKSDPSEDKTCATEFKGGWWYYSSCCSSCYHANLNGLYNGTRGIRWTEWQSKVESLAWAEMKIRPTSFS